MLQNFYGQGYLSGNATIMDGASLINIKKTKELSVAYVSNNLYSNSQFLINCIVRNSSGEYNAGYYLTPSFSKINMIPTNNNNQIIFNTSIEKYYSTIKSKIVLQFNGMLLKRNLFINNILNKNVSTSIRTQIKYITAFKSPLNLETSCTAISSQNTLSSNLQQVDKHSLWQYEGYAKLKIKASKNLYSNIVYGIYVFSSNNIYKTMDSYIVYKCEKHWTFSLSMHNLLNNKMLIQKSISANSLNEYSFRVVPRYVLGQIEFIF